MIVKGEVEMGRHGVMATPAQGELLEQLTGALGLGIALSDASGRPLWVNAELEADFPGVFRSDRSVEASLDEVTTADSRAGSFLVDRLVEDAEKRVLRGGLCRRSKGGTPRFYRHFQFDLDRLAAGPEETGPLRAHCLLDIAPERRLFETYRHNLQQLSSMTEILDLLYESLMTGEVLNLILVAVTSQQGFGFNRALFLEVSGGRLSGRLGIGPESAEEAHKIWAKLDESKPNLRETLQHLSQAGEPTDPATQALVREMNLPLNGFVVDEPDGISWACRRGRPTLVKQSADLPKAEQELFGKLGVDEIAVVPLTIRERLAGVLLADNFVTRKRISEGDLNLLKTFSGYAGLALERSSLYDDLTQNVSKLRVVNRDLHENQRLLLQAEKLSALGSLAATVSHEIRNPLVAIGGLAKSVLDDEDLSPDSKEALTIVTGEVQRLERFLKETLDFAKPTVDSLKDVDITALVRDVATTFRDEIQRSRADLCLKVPDEPITVSIAPDLVRGSLSNLIKNAVEAVSPGDTIRVGLRLADSLGPGPEGAPKRIAEFEVADTGPGISQEVRQLIFEPFFTTKKDGTGIGLAITKQNVQNLGGTISLETEPPFQTVLRIQLPVTTRSTQ